MEDQLARASNVNVDNNSSSRSLNASGRSWRKNSISSWDGEGDYYDDDLGSDEPWDEDDIDDDQRERQQQHRPEPLIVCQGLDHANTMGLNKTNCRIKSLMDWLIASMSSLFHHIPGSSSSSLSAPSTATKRWRRRPLVQIFGPKAQIDRGPAVAFNLYDQKGALIQPTLVQKLADRSSISLGCGVLSNLFLEEVCVTSGSDKENNGGASSAKAAPRKKRLLAEKCSSVFSDHSGGGAHSGSMKKLADLPVLTATLGLVSNFEDVHRLWTFAAKFLEPEFLTGELLRYQSLNQSIVSIDEQGDQAAADRSS
ncbi:uncharacterized protein LOC112342697 [Selaginella moellendorffii]|uniref:uncharacterized protein LOC112342697 n=1 Tax=Selaginella moellendorffii TaxID=88036 RepID=UPI000D1C961C|nr:uncharacterized protein LOC112342697 [Selaginella moellendorffii]|eukprot:XP_024520665.1 uncharacterized protein LOC112342697 [Selaginella moellendorffii]